MLFLCNIVNVTQRTFEIVKNRDHVNIINYIDKNFERTSTARAQEREFRDFHVRGTA